MAFVTILMAAAYIAAGLREWNFLYLILSMIYVMFCWLPDVNMLDNRGGQYENAYERNRSNPLFVRGFFREKESKSKLFSYFKHLYVCQMVSLVLLLGAIIYLCVMNVYRRIIILEIILTIGFVALMTCWVLIKDYYIKCYDRSFKYSESAEGIWTPFSYVYQSCKLLRRYNRFSCNYCVKYEDLQKRLEEETRARGYALSGCFEDDLVKDFRIFSRADGEKLDMFALIHIEELEEESWECFNEIFENFWKEDIAGKHEEKQMALTFLLCVDNYNKELRKKLNGIYTVDSRTDRYRLAAMLAYEENSHLDIWQDYQASGGGKRGRKLRRELLEMLDLSWDYNGKRYPADAAEEDFWYLV